MVQAAREGNQPLPLNRVSLMHKKIERPKALESMQKI